MEKEIEELEDQSLDVVDEAIGAPPSPPPLPSPLESSELETNTFDMIAALLSTCVRANVCVHEMPSYCSEHRNDHFTSAVCYTVS